MFGKQIFSFGRSIIHRFSRTWYDDNRMRSIELEQDLYLVADFKHKIVFCTLDFMSRSLYRTIKRDLLLHDILLNYHTLNVYKRRSKLGLYNGIFKDIETLT